MNERIVIVWKFLRGGNSLKTDCRLIVLFARAARVVLATAVREHNNKTLQKWQQLCAEYSLHAVIPILVLNARMWQMQQTTRLLNKIQSVTRLIYI